MVFRTLYSLIYHASIVVLDIFRLIFFVVIGVFLILFFMIKSILPTCNSNPLETGPHKNKINIHL